MEEEEDDAAPKHMVGDVVRSEVLSTESFDGMSIQGSMIDLNYGCDCVVVRNGDEIMDGHVAALTERGCC